MEVEIRHATIDDAIFIGQWLRDVDRREIEHFATGSATAELIRILQMCPVCMVAVDSIGPFLMFGAVGTVIKPCGAPWLVGTDRIQDHSLWCAMNSRRYAKRMLRSFGRLEGYVHEGNAVSKRWLAWIGFQIDDPVAIGLHGERYHRFWMDCEG